MEGNESEYLENVMKREELISLEIQERIGDKHVLLIGANPENLGSALAVIAAMNDAAIISVADINPSVVDFAEQLAERFPKVKINGFKADVTSQGSMDQLMTDCAAIGKIDFVVDLAAIFTIGREQDIPAKDLEKAREVDVDGSKNVILAAQKLENVPLVTLTSSIAIYFPKMKG
jgi:NAD(P)-dependent dehydrogenase (short-subunit alcohol dehydrogenase family)